jgi:membrane protein DedA with SNARE-associated domain
MATNDLPGVFGTISPLIDHHGYLAIAIIVLLANIGLPVPAESAVVVGAVFASNGHLDIIAVATVAAIAAIVGSGIGFAIGARLGHPLLVTRGRRVGITHERLDRAESFYRRRGVPLVLVARFLPLLRRWSGLVAGLSEMPVMAFGIANLVGAVGWAVAWVEIGDQAGNHLDTISRLLGGRAGYLVGAVVVLAIVIALVALRRRPDNEEGANA